MMSDSEILTIDMQIREYSQTINSLLDKVTQDTTVSYNRVTEMIDSIKDLRRQVADLKDRKRIMLNSKIKKDETIKKVIS